MDWLFPERRVLLLDFFRGLDAALDEHKAKGTQPGSAVYVRIHEQLAEDIAAIGIGKDNIPAVANAVGQLSTYIRLESLMPKQLGPDQQEAISHLENQVEKLAKIRANAEQAHADSPQFIGWESHTTDLLRNYISGNSKYMSRFNSLSFRSNVMRSDFPGGARFHSDPRRDDMEKFASDADVAVACLQGAIEYIKVFGLKKEESASPAKPARSRGARGGLTQHIYGPVNQAVAMDNAWQRVGHIGPSGNSLDEIVRLLRESEELTPRQVREAAGAAEQLSVEAQKEKGTRNWKAIAEWGATLLTIAEKATDLSAKLGPHLPTVAGLIEEAKRYF